MPAIYALLVGINKYPKNPLNGCINDVNAVDEFLQKTYGNQPELTLNIKRLTDEEATQPTRENFIAGFDHFAPAKDEDTCFFYYSGHGSYSPAPPEFWDETDSKSESFVCIDSREEGGRDLLDKEVGFLIWKTMESKKNTRFVVITDCCHCGTITRNVDDSGIKDRMMPDATTVTPLSDYLGFDTTINGKKYYDLTTDTASGKKRVKFLQGNHIHLAASRDNQTSKELKIEGQTRGAFTHSLLKTLYASNARISYRNLLKKTNLLVRNLVADQHPGLHLNGGAEASIADQAFLTKVSLSDSTALVYHDTRWRWCLKSGSIHGITTGDEVDIEGVGKTKVTGTPAPDFSTIAEIPGMVTGGTVYNATVTRQPNQPLAVNFDPAFDPGLMTLIEKAGTTFSNAVYVLSKGDGGKFIIRNNVKETFVTKPGSMAPLIKPVQINNDDDASTFLEQLQRVCKWSNLSDLEQNSFTDLPYKLTLYRNTIAGDYSSANAFEKVSLGDDATIFNYLEDANGEWHQPAFRFSIENIGEVPLWISNAYLGFDYSVNTGIFEEIELLAPGNETWLTYINEDGGKEDTISLNIDEKYDKLGYQEITEYVKLFIGTQPIDTDGLQQEGLELAGFRSKGVGGAGVIKAKSGGAFKWSTETVELRIMKPSVKTAITPGKTTEINAMRLAAHPALQANIAIVSSATATATRSAGTVLPPHAACQNSFLEPFNFAPGTRSASQFDMLELTDVTNPQSVSPEAPLVLTVAGAELDDVIPIGYDAVAGIYYPLGFEKNGELVIESLPDPTPTDPAINQRSLFGSIKIYFQKIIGSKLGMPFTYPRLAITTVSDDNKVSYDDDLASVSAAIAAAKRIYIFVHGIIGDTESMVKCVRSKVGTGHLKDHADLVLCFDYENLHTPIEENAALLKKRLTDAGVNPGHGKNITVIAHSMGGLVSRWFIEKLGGNKLVSRLVMLGTPNNGTPWADVRDMAETMLTYAMNGAAFLKPWMFVLNVVGKVAGGTQVTLKQMDKDTGIYKLLNDDVDPMIPYAVVAGNTRSIIPDYDKTSSLLGRIFTRLKKRGLYDALDVVLFKEDNDVAVTNKSITVFGNTGLWKTTPDIIFVPSDHMNYFNNKQALMKIAGV